MLALKVDGILVSLKAMVDGRILVALKATVDKNDNSHYEASNIARKAMFEGNHWVFQVLDNSKNYKNVNFYS